MRLKFNLKNKKISSFILKHVIRYPEGHSILTDFLKNKSKRKMER